ncbi:unnamed protein product [Parnassius mnemosyne]|uniref:Uncharacterized protein n=1 Tax=Parnassius mnemosyne TaxID=213953 RepID=A0AAV1K539_9NEOP
MALFVCKCLNVTLECDKIEDPVDIEKLELSPSEQRDTFFKEKLLSCSVNAMKSHIAQPALVGQRTVGCWKVEYCLACGQTTHAITQDGTNILICKSTQTTLERVNNQKKSTNFSPVFNLLLPEVTNDIGMKENVDTNNLVTNPSNIYTPAMQALGTLSKQLNQTLQSQLEAIEETVRQFRDQKYAEFEAYKERAQRDHKILSSIVNKARRNIENDDCRMDSSNDNEPLSPLLPPQQRRRLSSIKDAKKISQNITKTNIQLPHEEDSLDAEDIFDLDGMDSHDNMNSDQDDYDTDQGSNDEGIHISRPRGIVAANIAQSLPINVPNFPIERTPIKEIDNNKEPQDIAASIKALARSVHGDVYELPRPRFSTQI